MPNILDDIALPRDNFIHVKNNSDLPFDGIFNSKHYRIAPKATELMNYYLYVHFSKLYDSQPNNPLQILDDSVGSMEYARARAKIKEQEASEKIEIAKKAAAEAEQAKRELAEARVRAREFDGKKEADPTNNPAK